MADRIPVKFAGIDDWNRPIFKAENMNVYLSSVEILFPYGAGSEEVKKKITESDLLLHGTAFDDDPLGSIINPDKIKIVW